MATRWALLLVFAAVVIAALVVAFVPLMQVSYDEAEAHVVAEPYTTTEAYTEEVPVDYEVVEADSANLWWRRTSDCWVTLRNKGNVSGRFRVQFDLVAEVGAATTKVIWQTVEAGEQSKAVVRYYDDYVRSFTYSITPPMEMVTTSRQVPGTHDVVEYTEVERTKKVSVLEYMREWRGKS
jgi:hypothetical protein